MRRLEARQIARESHTVVEAIRKVARLSTVEMNVSSFQLKKDAKNLLGFIPIRCEKTVAIFYKGRVAAGFDFQEPGGVKLTTVPGTRRLLVELPPARLLYTDAPPPEVVVADGSLCNRLEASDYQTLTAEARGALEREALNAGILRQAEAHARELVRRWPVRSASRPRCGSVRAPRRCPPRHRGERLPACSGAGAARA